MPLEEPSCCRPGGRRNGLWLRHTAVHQPTPAVFVGGWIPGAWTDPHLAGTCVVSTRQLCGRWFLLCFAATSNQPVVLCKGSVCAPPTACNLCLAPATSLSACNSRPQQLRHTPAVEFNPTARDGSIKRREGAVRTDKGNVCQVLIPDGLCECLPGLPLVQLAVSFARVGGVGLRCV